MADSNIVVSGLTVGTGIGQLVADWAAVDTSDFRSLPYMQLDKFEVWVHTANITNPALIPAVATKVGETLANQYVVKGLAQSVTRWVFIRARDKSGNFGDFTAGASGTTSSVIPPPNSIDHGMLQDDSVDDNNLRVNSVKAEHVDVVNLEAISAILGDVVVHGSLLVNGTVITGKLPASAITSMTVSSITDLTVSSGGNKGTIKSASIAVTDGGSVLAMFFCQQSLPAPNASNNGTYTLLLSRGGTPLHQKNFFYDDNFNNAPALLFADTPGNGTQSYAIGMNVAASGGAADFQMRGLVLVLIQFKR
jgi:hypothetical protein